MRLTVGFAYMPVSTDVSTWFINFALTLTST